MTAAPLRERMARQHQRDVDQWIKNVRMGRRNYRLLSFYGRFGISVQSLRRATEDLARRTADLLEADEALCHAARQRGWEL